MKSIRFGQVLPIPNANLAHKVANKIQQLGQQEGKHIPVSSINVFQDSYNLTPDGIQRKSTPVRSYVCSGDDVFIAKSLQSLQDEEPEDTETLNKTLVQYLKTASGEISS